MPNIDFSQIQNKLADTPRLLELAKTREGQRLIKQIVASEASKLIDNTRIGDVNSFVKNWRQLFTDITRPNKFKAVINYGSETFDLSYFVKSITIPSVERNSIVFKRCGKTIKLPLNFDTPNTMNMMLYQDIDNKVYSDILFILNNTDYDYIGYNDVNNRAESGIDVAILYPVSMQVDLKTATNDFWNKLQNYVINTGIEFAGRAIAGNTNFEVLQRALSSDGLQNTGNLETTAKYFNNPNFFNFTFKVLYKNVFLDSVDEQSYDMEKQNTYQEFGLRLHYQDLIIEVYELDLKSERTLKGDILEKINL